jgi:hypothetical protein
VDITQFYSLAVLTRFQPFNSLEKEKAGKNMVVLARLVCLTRKLDIFLEEPERDYFVNRVTMLLP